MHLLYGSFVGQPMLANEQDSVWFENNVRPILAEHCQSCHSNEVGKTSGGLSLDSREDVLKGGESGSAVELHDPENSLIISAVRRESFEMPPEKPLPADQQAILEEWIRRGLPWPQYEIDKALPNAWLQDRFQRHWAWRINVDKKPPAVEPSSTATSTSETIDAFINSRLEELQIKAADRADALTLFRRACVDLTGLPPTVEQLEVFLGKLEAGVAADVAFAQAVDTFLSSEHFGVHWARHWLDLVRYSETMGHEFDYPIHEAWRYRDAIIQSLNQDVSYDRFVLEHIAGDAVTDPRIDPKTGINLSLALTGWWWFGDSVQAPVDVELDYATRLDNQIDVFSKTFLGMTVACARCHDHKFDAISTIDYYGLSSMLKSSRRVVVPTDPFDKIGTHDREMSNRLLAIEDSLSGSRPWSIETVEEAHSQLEALLEVLPHNPKVLETLASIDHPLAWLNPLVAPDSMAAWKAFQKVSHKRQKSMNHGRGKAFLSPTFKMGFLLDGSFMQTVRIFQNLATIG